MTKRDHITSNIASPRGQISIFFASSLVVLITVIAFIVNIGLFVKAKINLQNATDAAAYAGASVQAQHLTRIGYLNWEMRNIYKEWMFKYYVLGNLNIKDVDKAANASQPINFAMEDDVDIYGALKARDYFNFPSICIHFQSVASNVCKKYAVPGIPRFEATNMVGIDEATSAMIDSIVKTKAEDCTKRTELNFAVATAWAYGLPNNSAGNFAAKAPQIASDRPGAWPKAVELALRIRNLEYSVNMKPYTQGICANPSNAAGSCSKSIKDISTAYGNERISKAFYSGYRNLGNENDNEMKASFNLTELAPTPMPNKGDNSISYLLIPNDKREKYYLDLRLMTLNYATFFTALISRNDTVATDVMTQGACDVSKVALPVPGYPLGFYKNPELVTYYAVKGQANFIGLFNPFKNVPIKLTAYAAAKPMGGRIGPALFEEGSAGDLISRSDSAKSRSLPYIAGLQIAGTKIKGFSGMQDDVLETGKYAPGVPIPFNIGAGAERFWIEDPADIIGGTPQGNINSIFFGIPNLAYDLTGDFDTSEFTRSGNQKTYVINTAGNSVVKPTIGLFHHTQMKKFRSLLSGSPTPDEIKKAIQRSRAPTQYEAGNYLIPTAWEFMKDKYDSWGYVTANSSDGTRNFHFYAPLYAPREDVLYQNVNDVLGTIQTYIFNLSPALKKFRNSLNAAAISVANAATNSRLPGDNALYQDAAKGISDIENFSLPPNLDQKVQSCGNINGKFLHFLLGGGVNPDLAPPPADCTGIDPMITSIRDYYIGGSLSDSGFDPDFYEFRYTDPVLTTPDKLLTGYAPGPLKGASLEGTFAAPFSGVPESMNRNSYSTKFVSLKSLTQSTDGGRSFYSSNRVIYSEGRDTISNAADISGGKMTNTLDASLQQINQ